MIDELTLAFTKREVSEARPLFIISVSHILAGICSSKAT